MNKVKNVVDISHEIKRYVLLNYKQFFYGHDLYYRLTLQSLKQSISDFDIGEYWFELILT